MRSADLRRAVDSCFKLGVGPVNTNLALLERLLDLTSRQRALRLPEIFTDTVAAGEQPVVLDNTEILSGRTCGGLPAGIVRNRQVSAGLLPPVGAVK